MPMFYWSIIKKILKYLKLICCSKKVLVQKISKEYISDLKKEIEEYASFNSIFIKEDKKINDILDPRKPEKRDSPDAMMPKVEEKLFDSPKSDSKKYE